ncbi:MAG: hypothetical protein ACYC1C_06610 [Chloroflexota bacterium]|nr:hypothetical protein [Dehalococcoidales bacterium]
MRYIEMSGVFEIDDNTDPETFLQKLGEWAEERDWSAEVRLREVDSSAWKEAS